MNDTIIVLYVLTVIIGVLVVAVAWLAWQLRKTTRLKNAAETRTRELRQQTDGLMLDSLEARLNPHLFKNILNSIQSHAYQTYHALDRMAEVLDYILYESRKSYVTPQQEVEFALSLIEINKIKVSPLFDLKVRTKIMEGESLYTQRVMAPLICIDLIENAFKHADLQRSDAFISIVISFSDSTFAITVSNKISTRTGLEKEKSGLGTKTLQQRLSIIYGDNFKLDRFVENEVHTAHLKIHLLEHKAEMLAAR
jgi:LytS/YehU family sensor histidine kinase